MCITLTKNRIELLAWILLGIGLIVVIIQLAWPNEMSLAVTTFVSLAVIFSNFILLLASSKYIDFIPNPQVLQIREDNKVMPNFEPSVSGKIELKGEVHEIRIKSSNDIEIKSVTLFSENLMETEEVKHKDKSSFTIRFKQKRRLDIDFKVAVEGEVKPDIDVTKQFIEFEILYSVKILFNLIPVKYLVKIRVN